MKGSVWTIDHIPDLTGKLVIITGCNSGIGREALKILLSKKADIILACKDPKKLIFEFPSYQKKIHVISPLNLSDLNSVEHFANAFIKNFHQLDILINNAGIMAIPFTKTIQDIEGHFGINHIGHFVLTGYLIPILHSTTSSRVITVSSLASNNIVIPIFNSVEKDYDKIQAYNSSKFANLVFALELNRKLKNHSSSTISIAVHPGYVRTNLQRHTQGFFRKLHNLYTQQRYAHPVQTGVLSILRAGFDMDLKGGEYLGPDGKNELTGFPIQVNIPSPALDEKTGKDLWELSEKLSGFKYPFN